ncbi:response regulator [Sedimentisphaera salicampi]|uniref:Stalked cell differentiation-controlling protein n=1 Tax=Sedimentisphaera salicampi TaxID=1941349 RepID=A0A1W6LJC5_9BACT|nr:response regulator [Sedimentisphaera salicampi]ARN55843.1 Stalked cell differentiation-controlling protein [Sedimentisphaera salicampi]OXU16034.1 Stalked cell differentiation-controlling protein [Sedimentisphaera salicampi]
MLKRLLVVDDEPSNIFTLQSMLEYREDFAVDSTESGFQCIEMVKRNKYDLVYLDIMMPEIDGFQVCAKIKEINENIPVILVTALSDSDYLRKGFEAGAIDYIRKPVDDLELKARTNNILKNKEAENKIRELYSSLLRDLKVASKIQSHMLPPEFVVDTDMNFCSGYSPSTQIGGDLYDIIKLSADRIFVYIGDISGHGAQAALLMAAVKSTIRVIIEEKEGEIEPYELMNILNKTLAGNLFENHYMTLLAGVIDLSSDEFTFFNAGHLPIIQFNCKQRKGSQLANKGSIPIGWDSSLEYHKEEQDTITLSGDNIYILLTDGIIECEGPDSEELGIEGFIDLLESVIIPDTCLLLPHKVKSWLHNAGYEISQDDFSMLSYEKSSNPNTFTFELSQLTGAAESGITKFEPADYNLDNVSLASKIIERLCYEKSFSSKLAAEAELVTSEFVTNIISHGLKPNEVPLVLVQLLFDESGVNLRFVDNGVEWKPDILQASLAGFFEKLDKFSESGRGMAIIKSISKAIKRQRFDGMNETSVYLVND